MSKRKKPTKAQMRKRAMQVERRMNAALTSRTRGYRQGLRIKGRVSWAPGPPVNGSFEMSDKLPRQR